MHKICSICRLSLDSSLFNKDKSRNDGLRYDCSSCQSKRRRNKYHSNIELSRIKQKEYRSNNREQALKSSRKYYQSHKEQKKEYALKNKSKIISQHKKRENTRLQNDLHYKLSKRLRTRLYLSLKKYWKSGSAIRDLDCSIPELKQWLEQQFKEGMSWNNYGEWHIDHIIPLTKFDLTDPKQVKKACHWFNLQPLWAEENIRKSNYV